jgi:hypothetical protein
MNTQTFLSQLMAELPVWAQWIVAVIITICGPAILALVKSEALALNNKTAANGLLHGWRLAQTALAIPLPLDQPAEDAPEPPDTRLNDEIAAKQSELAALMAQVASKGTVLGALVAGLMLFSGVAFADATAAPGAPTTLAAPGWGPSVVGSVGAFYLNGNYKLLSAGVNVGAAYTWDDKTNVNSAGIYVGPQSQQVGNVVTTTINVMTYVNLYKTATIGSFGFGLGTQLWESGIGVRAPTAATTFLLLGYQF